MKMPTGLKAPQSIAFKDRNQLYRQYMPFIKNGGLFVPSALQVSLGDELFITVKLPEEDQRYGVKCKVVWITPKNASGRQAGFGIQFPEDHPELKSAIEKALAGLLGSGQKNCTM
jgi:type IV pilus assembly protein PilZ